MEKPLPLVGREDQSRRDGSERVSMLADRAASFVGREQRRQGRGIRSSLERRQPSIKNVPLGEGGVVKIPVGRDDVGSGSESNGPEGSIVVEAETLSFDHRDKIETGHRPLARAPGHERLESLERAASESLERQEAPGEPALP